MEERGSAFEAILVLLLKTIPSSSSSDAPVCANVVCSCARFMLKLQQQTLAPETTPDSGLRTLLFLQLRQSDA